MASRKAVAASIAASIIFSSLLVSNLVAYGGATENFRLVSLSTEERLIRSQAALIVGTSLLHLLDGSQELLSSGSFRCSDAIDSAARTIASEAVKLDMALLHASANFSLVSAGTSADDYPLLQPFNGTEMGMMNMRAVILVRGGAPDGSVKYSATDEHLLHIPLRLEDLAGTCLGAGSAISAALSGLGSNMCNSTALGEEMSAVLFSTAESAGSEGFALSASYLISSVQPCRVSYWITVQQQAVQGPEGPFTFTVEESGSVAS